MARRKIEGSRAIVTGASSGIGRAIALELARKGGKVVCLARREDRLQAAAKEIESLGGRVAYVVGDVTDPAARARCIEAAQSHFGGLDILVNNAGVGAIGPFETADPQRVRRIMEVNFFALVEMTRTSLPLLKQGRQPIIVNVSSILGRRGVPYNSEYAASKFAVHGFSESIRAEFFAAGIDVLVVSPGTTDTEFFDQVIESKGGPKWPEHTAVTAETVARATVRAIRRGSHEITPYLWGRVLVLLNRISPWFVDKLMARYA
ncbi:MAG: SDR family oxidoreductase [Thermoguttaceae bacterium]